ncbi:hypothetical protein C8J57DRAFT_1439801 [Mycena rebaudengoi]|nr:hypothetical protein C8J57DRAFT_1439801 [Mycena rebaudengoi]
MLALGLKDLPSDHVMDDIDKSLQKMCRVQSIRYSGKLGHVYYVNDLAAIIAQVQPMQRNLHFLPEDTKLLLSQAWQATLLANGLVCMPTRWFKHGNKTIARAVKMRWASESHVGHGWIVEWDHQFEVDTADFVLSFPLLVASHSARMLPDPKNIREIDKQLSPWTKTVPSEGNRWRKLSPGNCVVAFPVWLYCDDTSGNQSKKWNKHNSFLFTAAGLPCQYVHQESNIHFLSTSNIAPPLEMLDSIVDQLENCQEHGIWAWDAEFCELVLVIPSVLAMLGDNPMQSEFACHIGFRGNFFCHVCHVKGAPKQSDDEDSGDEGDPQDDESDSSVASDPDNTGIKDTFQGAFLNHIFDISRKKGRNKVQKQADISTVLCTFPADITSPVWCLKDFDPHQDIPVEILHVILLGFVKYFWRDAVARIKKPDKEILISHLSSFNVSGLGISPLPGHTLVNYSSSLTGRDFRTIVQAAPFVLQGLLPDQYIELWASLSTVVTLVWQPHINDINKYTHWGQNPI